MRTPETSFSSPQKVKKTIVFSKMLITNLKTKHRFISTQYKSSNSTEKQINSWMQRVKRLYWARVRATFKTSSRANCYNNVCPHDSVLKKLYIRSHQTLNIGVLRPNVIFGKYAILGLEMKLSRTFSSIKFNRLSIFNRAGLVNVPSNMLKMNHNCSKVYLIY